jgi:hypothetical protein
MRVFKNLLNLNDAKEIKENPMVKPTLIILGIMLAVVLGACQTSHEVKPIEVKTVHEVKPMHITIDVNIKVDRALDDFFGEIDQAEEELYQDTGEDTQTQTEPSTD